MAEELPSLHIDTDWKKQAQEEKRKLAEQAAAKQKAAAPAASAVADSRGTPAIAGGAAPAAGARRGRAAGEAPQASFASLVQSIMTQVLYYLGEMAVRGGEPMVNFDMAKYQLDTLGVLEQKTANNLTTDEKKLIDTALYETRMRFINVVSQYIS